MEAEIDERTLLIIPCCKSKCSGGNDLPPEYVDPLTSTVSSSAWSSIITARTCQEQYLTDNLHFLPAIDRYTGSLYRPIPEFSSLTLERTNTISTPKLLILSALYGPLHPESLINDYDLKMPSTKKSVWMKNFPEFLSDYVATQNVSSIRVYFGQSTGYFKVANNAIKPILQSGGIENAIQYQVEDGGSYLTPYNHGLKLAHDLKLPDPPPPTRPITTCYL